MGDTRDAWEWCTLRPHPPGGYAIRSLNCGSYAVWRSDGVPWPRKGWCCSACRWGWGGLSLKVKCASQVEHSSTKEQGCMWVCTSICARPQFECGSCAIWRSDGVPWPWKGGLWRACTWRWGGVSGQVKWSTQVQESKADCMWYVLVECMSIRVCDPQFELRFVCDMAV